jgi:serine/threonine protein kinase
MVKGKKVGKYELGKTLGSGSFSKVKLGIDDTGKQYAVKIIDKEQLIRENMEDQLKREISIMKMLNHPFIVNLYDVLQTQNNIYLILELVTGGELFDRIVSAKKFDEDTGRRFFQQLVVALHFCHKQGVCHRDLKPENLLVDDKGSIKITDFGLANIQAPSDPAKLLSTVCGTPNYVAPEVLKEKGYKGSEADVWSCGVILFVMLAGYLPFDDPNINVLFQKIDKGEYRMCKTFSEPVKDLVSKLLITDPAKRPTLDWVIKHPWFTKNWDRSVFDTFNGSLVTPDVITTWSDKVEKEQVVTQPAPAAGAAGGPSSSGGGAADALGAFDLITQLAMATMSQMTSNRPVLKVFTRFIVGEGCDGALTALAKVLTDLQSSPKTKAESREIKGFLNKQKGLLTYVVTVYPLVCSSFAMVEVRRGRGDTFDFHELYHAIIHGLGKLVRSKSVVRDTDLAAGEEQGAAGEAGKA